MDQQSPQLAGAGKFRPLTHCSNYEKIRWKNNTVNNKFRLTNVQKKAQEQHRKFYGIVPLAADDAPLESFPIVFLSTCGVWQIVEQLILSQFMCF